MLLERMALRGKIEAMKTDGKLVEREKKDVGLQNVHNSVENLD